MLVVSILTIGSYKKGNRILRQ